MSAKFTLTIADKDNIISSRFFIIEVIVSKIVKRQKKIFLFKR